MGRLGRFGALFVLILLLATEAVAQSQADRQICFSPGVVTDARLLACERLITSGQLSKDHLAGAYNSRGLLYRSRGQFDAALQEIDAALTHAVTAVFLSNRGLVLTDKKEFDRAIADYDAAIRIDPSRADFYRNRAIAFEWKGELHQALSDLRYSRSLNPNDPTVAEGLKRLELRVAAKNCTSSTIASGTDEDKLQQCERAITSGTLRADQLWYPYHERGVIYYRRREYDRAIAELTEALKPAFTG